MGPQWADFGVGVGSTIVFRSTHIVEQLLFLMFSSILTFDFDIILGPLFTFWDPNGLFFGVGVGFKKTALGSTHVVEQLYFFMLP